MPTSVNNLDARERINLLNTNRDTNHILGYTCCCLLFIAQLLMGSQRRDDYQSFCITNISQMRGKLNRFDKCLLHKTMMSQKQWSVSKLIFTLAFPLTPKAKTPPKPFKYFFAFSWEGWCFKPGYETQDTSSLASNHSAKASVLSRWRWTLRDKVSRPIDMWIRHGSIGVLYNRQ